MTEAGERAAVTVGALLRDATARLAHSGSESPRLDAELLLGHVLGVDRTTVLAHPEALVGGGQRRAFGSALGRRQKGEPVAYIRGLKEFFGLAFSTDARALIPRPETELIVELALDRVREALAWSPRAPAAPRLRIWDVGTGSGAIAVTLAVTLRWRGHADDVAIVASDVSSHALALATENAVAHGVTDMVALHTGDLLDLEAVPRPVDLVVANLPYVRSEELPTLPAAARFEPVAALDGGPDGLDTVRRFLTALPAVLGHGGTALLEIGSHQGDAAAAAAAPSWIATIHPDLSRHARVMELRRA